MYRHGQDQGEDSFHGLFSLMCLGGFVLGINLISRLRDMVFCIVFYSEDTLSCFSLLVLFHLEKSLGVQKKK